MEDIKWLTLEEFAETSRLHLDTVRRYCREGRLPVRKVAKRYLLKQTDAAAFMESAPVPYPKPPASTRDKRRGGLASGQASRRKRRTGTEGD